jgi:hypothetical protein
VIGSQTALRPGNMVLAGCCVALAACGAGSSGGTGSHTAKTVPAASGVIRVVYDQPSTQAGAQAREILKLGGTDGVAKGFTHSFKLPKDVTIHVVDAFEGPNYNPATRTITLSYGFTEYVAKLLLANFPALHRDQSELGREWAAVDGFILVHEFGHALIDLYQLPVLGKEEDAADALAAVFMTRFVTNGSQYAFDAAKFFDALSARQRNLAPSDYWDAHSLDKQRAYSIVCWIAGANSNDFNVIEKAGILSPSRLQSCPSEYQQRVRSWLTLLKPHVRG